MHPVIWWILVGGLAGILAKALSPGDRSEPKGCLMTILLGIAGSVAVGFLLHTVLGSSRYGGFWGTLAGATIGALVLIAIARAFEKRSS